MKNIGWLCLLLFAQSSFAEWTLVHQEKTRKFVFCSGNTGTDGDLLFDIEAQVVKSEYVWKGEGVTIAVRANDQYEETTLEIDSKVTAYLGDVTDVSPLSPSTIKLKLSPFEENLDITLVNGRYRVVLPRRISSSAEFTAPDSYNGTLGITNCSLNDESYNKKIEEIFK